MLILESTQTSLLIWTSYCYAFSHGMFIKLKSDKKNISIYIRVFHTPSDMLGDLVKLSLYPTNQKSKIAAKYTASDGGSKSA